MVDEHLDQLSQIKPINDADVSGLQRFGFVSAIAQSGLLFKTNCPQPLVVKDANKLNDAIAQHACSPSQSTSSRW